MKFMPGKMMAVLMAFVMLSSILPLSMGNSDPILSSPGKIRTYWYATWGGEENETITDIGVVNDGIYACGVVSNSNSQKAFLLKFNDKGKLQWNNTWGEENTRANALQVYEDAVYVVGTMEKNGNEDIFVAKYDGEGNRIWLTRWGGSSDDEGNGIKVYDDRIYVCGSTRSFGSLGNNVVVVKLNLEGEVIWYKIWGSSKDEGGNGIEVTSNGIFVSGYTTSYGVGGKDVLIIGLNSQGEENWIKTWGGSSDDEMLRIAYARPYLYTAGITSSYTPHALVLKYDESGNMLFERRWGGSSDDEARDVEVYEDVFYITGITKSYGKGGDVFLAKYKSSDGMLSWSKIWGGKKEDGATSLAIYNGRIYIGGYTESYGNGKRDALIIKTGLEGRKSFSLTSGEIVVLNRNAIYIGGREIMPLLSSSRGDISIASCS